MRRAIELSVENVNAGRGGPFAALVVRSGEVIAEGTNLVTSTNDPTAHAEVVAIREACRRLKCFELKGCEIYSSAEPCPMCMGLVYWARLAKVYYGNSAQDAAKAGFDDAFIYRELTLPSVERAIPMEQIMRQEARAGFVAWEKKPDKIIY
jgi:tRNA(Arg) A34 adenosine deaminase TadA